LGPTSGVGVWLVPLVVAFLLAVGATPLAIAAARRFNIIDRPVGLKIHKVPTPLLGGLAVYGAFLLATLLFLPWTGPVRGLIVGGAIAIAVGVIDDRFNLPSLVHLGGQILAALVTVVVGVGVVRYVSIPWHSPYAGGGSWRIPLVIGFLFTIFWIVGMMNTINFLDGLDGLSGGVGVIAAVLLARWAASPPSYIAHASAGFHHADLVLPVILAGALLGFLPFNWNPARVFIGDSGAMFLGLALGALSIFGVAKIGTALLVLSIPVLDVAWAIVRRQMQGKSFLAGDKQHVYHRMVELGLSPTATVLCMYSICLALGIVDLGLSRLDKLIAFVVVVVLVGTSFVLLEVAGNRKQAARGIRPRSAWANGTRYK